MKHAISHISLMAACVGASATASAQDASFKTACTRAGDERIIEIVAPGNVGAACDVQYTYLSSNTVKVPYHANNSSDFCSMKAQDIIADLASQGYACGPYESERVAAAPTQTAPEIPAAPAQELAAAPAEQLLAQEPAPDAGALPPAPAVIAEAELAEAGDDSSEGSAVPEARFTSGVPAETPAVEAVAEASPVTESAIEEAPPASEERVATAALEPALEPAGDTAQVAGNELAENTDAEPAADELTAELNDMLREPAPRHTANAGPADLTDKAEPNIQGAGRKRAVGRLVGAEPDAGPPPEVELAAAEPASSSPAPQQQGATAVTNASADASMKIAKVETPVADAAKFASRAPADIIRSTLNAQVAAWNEGNLDAFMETYWKSEDLKFVTGTEITKGWAPTLRRYRSEYADGGDLGELGLDRIDVELVTDDVAVVTGRFKHAGADETSGVFSLVMRRDDGAWRIVHDHTVTARAE